MSCLFWDIPSEYIGRNLKKGRTSRVHSGLGFKSSEVYHFYACGFGMYEARIYGLWLTTYDVHR